MGLEAATFVQDLDVANPVSSDKRKQGDDHLRLIKSALKTTFPTASKAFYNPSAVAKTANYTVLAGDMNKFITGDATAAGFNLTLPTLAAGDAGWTVYVQKIDSSANAVTVVGTINGGTNFAISGQYDGGVFYWSGSAWLSFPFYGTSGTSAGFSREITEVEAGAAVGPIFSLFRDSATPANNDILGAYDFNARDSGGNKTLVGRILSQWIDVTDLSEDANLVLQTIVAGTLTTLATLKSTGVDVVGVLTASNGLTVTAGAVAVPAAAIANAALQNGHVLQVLQTTNAANIDLTTTIPYDDTTPTSSEGTSVLSQAITPADNTNKVLCRASLWGDASASGMVIAALFRGTTCIQVVALRSNQLEWSFTFEFLDSPASASAQTYSVRVGQDTASGGVLRLNGSSAARMFGGTSVATLTVMEISSS